MERADIGVPELHSPDDFILWVFLVYCIRGFRAENKHVAFFDVPDNIDIVAYLIIQADISLCDG